MSEEWFKLKKSILQLLSNDDYLAVLSRSNVDWYIIVHFLIIIAYLTCQSTAEVITGRYYLLRS